MRDSHFELTGEKMDFEGHTLHRIRATRDLNHAIVRSGQLGGWIEGAHVIREEGWVGGEAKVFGGSAVHGFASVEDNAIVRNYSHIHDSATVLGNSVVYNNSGVFENACIAGSAKISNWSVVRHSSIVNGPVTVDNARIAGGTRLYRGSFRDTRLTYGRFDDDSIDIANTNHVLVIEHVGSENVNLVLCRANNSDGHVLSIGCWEHGRIDEMMDEVHQRKDDWGFSEEATERIVAEYEAMIPLLRTRVARWQRAAVTSSN